MGHVQGKDGAGKGLGFGAHGGATLREKEVDGRLSRIHLREQRDAQHELRNSAKIRLAQAPTKLDAFCAMCNQSIVRIDITTRLRRMRTERTSGLEIEFRGRKRVWILGHRSAAISRWGLRRWIEPQFHSVGQLGPRWNRYSIPECHWKWIAYLEKRRE